MMNRNRPNLLSCSLWKRCEAFYLNQLVRALELLRHRAALPPDEVSLNRELYFCLLEASRELDPQAKYPPVLTECCNQPDLDDAVRSKREDKRPDFQWTFTDPHEPDIRRSAKQFVCECKRLGSPTSREWVLNANYVTNGVCRFADKAWGYGQRFASGVMVGYWQTMEPDAIRNEVNATARKHGLPNLALTGGWQPGGVSKLEHSFARSFPISPFRLDHLWVDVRIAPARSKAPTAVGS